MIHFLATTALKSAVKWAMNNPDKVKSAVDYAKEDFKKTIENSQRVVIELIEEEQKKKSL